MDFEETMKINLEFDKAREVKDIVSQVYEALKVKGYDPISQIVGYLLSGDPTYITSYNGARGNITKIERAELLEELVKNYIKNI
ncbi:MAG: IreB family regulatory phosphoprotein [Firmicutes bacterium]|nr:IreB family regulatory phosphoprotein [Bacillota bacterium]